VKNQEAKWRGRGRGEEGERRRGIREERNLL
jgi:hypothetical protein